MQACLRLQHKYVDQVAEQHYENHLVFLKLNLGKRSKIVMIGGRQDVVLTLHLKTLCLLTINIFHFRGKKVC